MSIRFLQAPLFVSISMILFVLTSSPAQPQTNSGVISGIVSGPNDTPLPGTVILITERETGETVRLVSGGQGVYRAPNLNPGAYEVRAQLEGFEPKVIPGIEISHGVSRTVNIAMTIATIRSIVTVVGALPKAALETAQVRESSARDVGEALQEINGIQTVRKGGIAGDLVLRGFQGKDLNVLVDGERIYGACPNQMDPPAFHADFAEVERVEVGKGPFDIRNQGSLGGIVNIVTRQPALGLHLSGVLSAGSFGYINPSATVSYGGRMFSALTGYSYRRSEPYSDGAGSLFTEYANYRSSHLETDAFRVGSAWAKLSVSPHMNHLVQFSFARQQADHVLYPYLQMDAVYDDGDRINLGYHIARSSGRLRSLNIQAYFTEVRHWMTDEFRVSSASAARDYSMGTMARTKAYGGKFETTLGGLLLGLEAFDREWDATTELAGNSYQPQYSIPDIGTVSIGVYGSYSKSLTDRLRLNLGGRVDRARTVADAAKANTNLYFAYNSSTITAATDTYPSATARLSFRASNAIEISGSAGSTVRVPDARERFFALRRMGSDWVGNPQLVPSRNTGADASVAVRLSGLVVESSLYLNRIGDFITVVRRPKVNAVAGVMNVNARSYQNVDAQIYGSELRLSYSVTHRLFLSGDLSYLRGTQNVAPERGILSSNLAEMPPLNARAGLRYEDGLLLCEIEGVFAGAQRNVDTSLNEAATPGYGVTNLKAGINYKRFALRLGIDNLWNRDYYQHLSYQRDPFRSGARVHEPGRNLYVSLLFRY